MVKNVKFKSQLKSIITCGFILATFNHSFESLRVTSLPFQEGKLKSYYFENLYWAEKMSSENEVKTVIICIVY